jgi:hypothetical protein
MLLIDRSVSPRWGLKEIRAFFRGFAPTATHYSDPSGLKQTMATLRFSAAAVPPCPAKMAFGGYGTVPKPARWIADIKNSLFLWGSFKIAKSYKSYIYNSGAARHALGF